MQAMVCELCGSSDIIKQDGIYICQHCGTKYSVEEAKKLIGVVTVDKSAETEKLLILARRARDENNEENAAKYYDMVLRDDPTSWEASFYLVFFQAMSCKIIGIASAAHAVANNINGTMSLIHDHVEEDKQVEAMSEVILRAGIIANMLAQAAKNHYDQHSSVDGVDREYIGRACAACDICEELERSMKQYFPSLKVPLAIAQKIYLSFICEYAIVFKPEYVENTVNRLTNEIRQQDSSYNPPEIKKKSGRYIATAVYGSYDCPQVWTLRRYRDFALANTWCGRVFIHAYYAVSPTIVKWFGETQWFKTLWRAKLDRMIQKLNADGYEDTPYSDRGW